MAIRDKKGRWISSSGKAVPVSKVRPIDREKDRTVETAYNQLMSLLDRMEQDKQALQHLIEDYKHLAEEEYGVTFGEGGNLTLTDYSGVKQLEVKVNKQIAHDEKLQLAETCMREALLEDIEALKQGNPSTTARTEKALNNLLSVVDHAFELSPSGHVSRTRIIQLKQVNYDHPKWQKGLKLIDESEVVRGTKTYIHLRERRNASGEFDREARMETIQLNFSVI